MKKNLISLAVAASVLGGASVHAGQYVNPEGTGQVLMFPFYNAENNNATNFHLVNTTAEAKAVKVRFVEHKNSDEVLDFNLYLSAYDHFAFGVIGDPNGNGAAIITQDNSCTVPELGSPNGAFSGTATEETSGAVTRVQPFVNYQYANSLDVDSTIERALTGHLEVIEMGVVVNQGSALDPLGKLTQWESFITHGANDVPANCDAMAAAWATKKMPAGATTAPTGGLYGLAYAINVDSAAAFGFEPTAVADWADGSNYHTNPGLDIPNITQGKKDFNVQTGATENAQVWTDGTATNGAQAISAILMTDSLTNDVMINPAIGGMTDWVVTFPTKKYHVDVAGTAAEPIAAPFTDNWQGTYTTAALTKKEDPACEIVQPTAYDREENTAVGGNGFSPAPESASSLICNETAVISMGPAETPSALNVEMGLTSFAFPYTEGWLKFGFGGAASQNAISKLKQEMTLTAGNNSLVMTGLPVIGFAAYKVSNGAMSYGNAAEHKYNSNNVVSSK